MNPDIQFLTAETVVWSTSEKSRLFTDGAVSYKCMASGKKTKRIQGLRYISIFTVKVVFLHMYVILSTGERSASVHAGIPPLWEQVPPRAGTPQAGTPPGSRPPPSSACWEIRSTSGRYASYWNAILSKCEFHSKIQTIQFYPAN